MSNTMETQTLLTQEYQLIERLVADAKTSFLSFALINGVLTLAILIDLVLGIAKAKLEGNKVQSYKARKSAIKMISYYGSILMCFMCDLIFILCDIYETPYLSMLIGASLVFIEIKSWFEKLSDKEQARIEHSAKVLATALTSINGKANVTKIAEGLTDDSTPAQDEAPNLEPAPKPKRKRTPRRGASAKEKPHEQEPLTPDYPND